jgi:hypothetical protein
MECEFCNQSFSTRANLNKHQKTAQYCLGIQQQIGILSKCEYCKTYISDLTKHYEDCINYNKKISEDRLKDIQIAQQKIIEQEKRIEKLENTIIGIAESKNEIEYINFENTSKQIEKLTNQYGKKQRRKQINEPNVIYILTTPALKEERRYIFGKSKNLTNRLSTYNKTDEHEIVYYQACGTEGNMDTIEKMVLNRLEKYREVENRDRFILPEDNEIDLFIDVIKKCIDFIIAE